MSPPLVLFTDSLARCSTDFAHSYFGPFFSLNLAFLVVGYLATLTRTISLGRVTGKFAFLRLNVIGCCIGWILNLVAREGGRLRFFILFFEQMGNLNTVTMTIAYVRTCE